MAENLADNRAQDSRFWKFHTERREAQVKALEQAATWLRSASIPAPTDITFGAGFLTVNYRDIQSLAFARTIIEGAGLSGTWEFGPEGFFLVSMLSHIEIRILMDRPHLKFDLRELVKLLEMQ